MGEESHALSAAGQGTAVEVLAANGVQTIIQRDDGVTPPPVISRAILVYNRGRKEHLADGIVITPSHNPPEDGGFKYNPTNGGPADTDVTKWVQDRANELLRVGNSRVNRMPFATAIHARPPPHGPRLGPAWHRPAHRGVDDPHPLPGRRHPLPTHAPPPLAGAGRGRQDAGQQQHDRPRGAKARPPAVRGAGGLQVVHAGLVRWLNLLRWRGECRGELPAARRHRVDNRQG